uniref:Sulfotransferase n=1 Tax=Chrysemys picta bellii TaxID=8478 RepID=A0A8C3F5D7_CHRPI
MNETELTMEPSEEFLFKHKGFYFHPGHVTPEYIDSLEDFEIRDSDVFVAIFFPRNVWIQNILSFIYHEGHRDGTENMKIIARVPWLEYNVHNMDYVHRPSSRLFTTHLPYYLVPRDLRNRREKVIYVARNPKDVAVSYFHFSNFSVMLETIPDFNIFLERLLLRRAAGAPEGKWALPLPGSSCAGEAPAGGAGSGGCPANCEAGSARAAVSPWLGVGGRRGRS